MEKLKAYVQQLAPISDQEFEDAAGAFSKVHLQKGDYFVRAGRVCDQIAFINGGTLRVYYINDKGEEITSCFCSEHHLTTSYKSFILQQPSVLSIVAIEDSELLTISYDDLQKLYATSIGWQALGRAVAEREYFIMESYASILNTESATEKYKRLLREQPEVVQKSTVEDIASYLGVTRRTLSRIRQQISKL